MGTLRLLIYISALLFSSNVIAKKCLYISSYHQGYAWSDGIEKGVIEGLQGKCKFKQFDMDTKRNKSEAFKKQAALTAKELIASWKPDVVIASDDNASKYLIKPYFKNHTLPFVFCGVNWNTKAYGFPYDNVTGMVEIAPIKDLFKRVNSIQGQPEKAFYLGADTLTEQKNLRRYKLEAEHTQFTIKSGLAQTNQQWLELYKEAQNYDLVIIGSHSGINDWNHALNKTFINKNTRKLSVTIHEWMMPYSMYGLTKIPEEQGLWAAQAASYILEGISPNDIPIVSNRKWDVWVNKEIMQNSPVKIPSKLLKKAKITFNK